MRILLLERNDTARQHLTCCTLVNSKLARWLEADRASDDEGRAVADVTLSLSMSSPAGRSGRRRLLLAPAGVRQTSAAHSASPASADAINSSPIAMGYWTNDENSAEHNIQSFWKLDELLSSLLLMLR